MTRSPAQFIAAAAGILVVSAACRAQTSALPTPQPIRPGLPGTAREELGIDRPPPLVREGAFVASARGIISRGKSGRWFVVFDKDARGRQMPPMVILPSQYLAAMERVAARFQTQDADAARTRVLVTGQVLVYMGHNFLLPTAPPILETTAPTNPPEPATEKSAAPVEQPDAETTEADQPKPEQAEPSIDQIIGDLDRALGARRTTNPAAVTSTETLIAEAGGARVRPAGFMTARRGRIVRAAAGEPTFVVDSGTSGEVAEPPMILLPCTNLAAIESLAERMGESATFTISGQVTVYRGRNYLLPTTYTMNRVGIQVIPTQ